MRIEGQLKRWNGDRGFGFITSDQGGPEIFVHVSAFPKDGQRPRIGERLSFEIEIDNNGKQRAIHLVCLDRQVRRPTSQGKPTRRSGSKGIFKRIFQLAIVVALAAYGYAEYSNRTFSKPIATVQSARSCPAPWCKKGSVEHRLRHGGSTGQAATADRLTLGLSPTSASVSSVM